MAEASPSRALLSAEHALYFLPARSNSHARAATPLLVELTASYSLSNPPVAGSPWQKLVTGDRSAVGHSVDGGGSAGGRGGGGGASGGGGGGYLEHQVVSHTLHSYPLFQFPHACRSCVHATRHKPIDDCIFAIDARPQNHVGTLKV